MADTVTVACNLPNGLILRVFNMAERSEPVMGGGTKIAQYAVQAGEPVTVHGAAVPFGAPPRVTTAGGYALTPNVDAEFWAKWLEQNKDHDAVKNGLIFALPRQDSAAKEAENRSKVKSGLEPLDPEKPMKGIAKADKAA